jgi:transposase
MRLQAAEIRIDADLHLGQHAELITELRQLTGSYPLRERLHGLLMLALYRDGRQGEALAAYQHARRALVGEHGIEPCAWLRELHQQILTGDPALDTPAPARPGVTSAAPAVPRELPARVTNFTGRLAELDTLTRLLGEPGAKAPGTVVISVIGGTAGVGKTALVVHWAHQVAGWFPDGQLYVNLRGYDPGEPMPAADALARFLRALGVPGQDIPAEEDERAALYRSRLSGRRMLVLLDNARSAEQVRPLLPGTPDCAVVVTSRDSLAGLVAREGAARLDLDLLRESEAVSLLRALIGGRVHAEPAAAQALAGQCARLPLALRVAAEMVIARPAARLSDLVRELAGQRRRLNLLDAAGDSRTALRAVFSWSCRHLDASAASTFQLAGLHPGLSLDSYAAAALTGATVERAAGLLEQLARAHLMQPIAPGRYGMHDLLRDYAAEQAADHDAGLGCRQALTRLFDHYLSTAVIAMDTLYPAENPRLAGVSPSGSPLPPVAEPAAARAWLDAHRAALVAAAAYTADHGWPSHASRLATVIFRCGLGAPDAGHVRAQPTAAAARMPETAIRMARPVRARPPRDDSEARKIRRLAGARHAPADWIERAQIVARSWDGLDVAAIAAGIGCHEKTVRRWLHRFNAAGIDGLGNRPGAGRKRRITQAQRSAIIALARSVPPGRLARNGAAQPSAVDEHGPAQWTLDTLTQAAQADGIRAGRSQIRRILLAERVPWRQARGT